MEDPQKAFGKSLTYVGIIGNQNILFCVFVGITTPFDDCWIQSFGLNERQIQNAREALLLEKAEYSTLYIPDKI